MLSGLEIAFVSNLRLIDMYLIFDVIEGRGLFVVLFDFDGRRNVVMGDAFVPPSGLFVKENTLMVRYIILDHICRRHTRLFAFMSMYIFAFI